MRKSFKFKKELRVKRNCEVKLSANEIEEIKILKSEYENIKKINKIIRKKNNWKNESTYFSRRSRKKIKKRLWKNQKFFSKLHVSIIEYLVECLLDVGINKIYVVVGYKSKLIKKTLKNSVNYIDNKKFKKTNSIYSLYLAKKKLINSNFILMNGDIFISKIYFAKMINQKKSCTYGIKRKKYKDGEMNIITKKIILKSK